MFRAFVILLLWFGRCRQEQLPAEQQVEDSSALTLPNPMAPPPCPSDAELGVAIFTELWAPGSQREIARCLPELYGDPL